jgi:hypothetical protein
MYNGDSSELAGRAKSAAQRRAAHPSGGERVCTYTSVFTAFAVNTEW